MIIKILVIGEAGTGKTSLVNRHVNDTFLEQTRPTIACDLLSKPIKLKNQLYHVQLWDIGGADRLGGISKIYCRGAHGAMVVADISDDRTLESQDINDVIRAKHWKEQVASQVCLDDGAPLPVMLLVNKHDKVQEDAKRPDNDKIFKKETMGMQPSQLQHFINNYYFVGWRWVSAKTGQNVELAFSELIDEILAHDIQKREQGQEVLRGFKDSVLSYHGRRQSISISDGASKSKSKGCCG